MRISPVKFDCEGAVKLGLKISLYIYSNSLEPDLTENDTKNDDSGG
jgi:hypothetical protein